MSNWLPRFVYQRGLGLIYLIAFLAAVFQFVPLLGEHGLLPVPLYVSRVPFRETPSLFFLAPHDWAFTFAAWFGVALACAVVSGLSDRFGPWVSAAVWAVLWLLYLSFVNVGQTFYAFGWETMLCEAGFFAIFLGSSGTTPRDIPLWIVRWMEFRLMFGAGLIKLRGDSCWRDLTCLDYHYETQPMPNPLSWYFHWMPRWVHHGGVAFNHFAELIVPFAYFAPQPFATIAGLLTILFQLLLMLSGNLSFLNLLTIVLAVPLLDARLLARVVRERVPEVTPPWRGTRYLMTALGVAVAALSVQPVLNLIEPGQVMNSSYDPLHLVNTYGAFGSITRTRYEVVVEGTADAEPDDSAVWREYEFKGKPGDPMRRPPQIAPYHLRLDWQMWFAAMGPYEEEPWFVNFAAKLLKGDRAVAGLLRENPFAVRPPRYIRAWLYQYRFTTPAERRQTGAWWKRRRMGPWFPAVSLDTRGLREALRQQGWE
ncbi:MAG: lipase maturation factor family protein [Candidatus Sulfopaludibacter sp.]|nr:lipase maturation factor family protein [Candidatus Sulfopaludibacter sp.]